MRKQESKRLIRERSEQQPISLDLRNKAHIKRDERRQSAMIMRAMNELREKNCSPNFAFEAGFDQSGNRERQNATEHIRDSNYRPFSPASDSAMPTEEVKSMSRLPVIDSHKFY